MMGLMTLEGIVKGGQIRLKSGIDLPENAKVYVILSDEWSEQDLAEFSQASILHATTTMLATEQAND